MEKEKLVLVFAIVIQLFATLIFTGCAGKTKKPVETTEDSWRKSAWEAEHEKGNDIQDTRG